MNGISWGVWWGLGLERPAPVTLPPVVGQTLLGTGSKLPRVVVSKRNAKTLRAELALAPGPLMLERPNGGTLTDLHGSSWAVGLYESGPQLFQARSGVWQARDGGAALAGLNGARHVSLAWDQAARPVIAWEVGGMVYVRQWDGLEQQYVTRGPWAGCDPVLLADGPLLGATDDSDVQLYHLNTGRVQVVGRIQRDLYAVPRAVATLPSSGVLDQVVSLSGRVQLVGSLDSGETWALASVSYPVRVAARVGLTVQVSGVLFETLLTASGAEAVALSGRLVGLIEDTQITVYRGYTLNMGAALVGTLEDAAPKASDVYRLALGGQLVGTLATIVLPAVDANSLSMGGSLSGVIE